MTKPVVLVDLDDVLADFDAATITELKKRKPGIVIPVRHNFHIHHNYDNIIDRLLIKEIHNSPGFFRNLPLMKEATYGWQKLCELGYHPRICTAPLKTNPWCIDEKRAWVHEHFGNEVADDMIIDSEKWRHNGIALIDDRPDIKNAEEASWQHILFDNTYNHSLKAPFRLNGWQDQNLENILSACQKLHQH